MIRLYPAFVSLLGSFGVATTLVYFAAVVLSFVPGFSWISERMVGTEKEFSFGFLFVVVPYLLITAHLYLRTKLGLWLVERGAFDQAIIFSGKRTTSSFLRSRAEALCNRIALALAWAKKGEIDRAIEVLDGERPAKTNAFFWWWAGWKALMLLRDDQTTTLAKFLDDIGKPRGKRSAVYAAVGSIYFFEAGDRERAGIWLQSAQWADDSELEVQLAHSIVIAAEDADVWRRAVDAFPSRDGERCFLIGGERRFEVDDRRSRRFFPLDEEE